MTTYNNINTQGLFVINNEEYPGTLYTKPNSPVTIKLIVPSPINFDIDKVLPIKVVTGVMKERNEEVTLLDPILYNSFWSTSGCWEYTIQSNLAVFGKRIENTDSFKIDNISFISYAVNKLIGNSSLKAVLTKENIWHFDIKTEDTKKIGEFDNGEIFLHSFYNFDKSSLRSKIIIEQINSLDFKFKQPQDLYEAVNILKKIENLLTFLFKKEIGIDEIVFFEDILINHISVKSFRHIYYNDDEKNSSDINLRDLLLTGHNTDIRLGLYISNWIRLSNEVKYLNYFIRLYYKNNFIEQKIIGQINLLEAFHRFYFGTKKPDTEKANLLNAICSEIVTPAYKIIVNGWGKSKTGFSLVKKIDDLAKKVNYVFDKKIVAKANKLRQQFSHGDNDNKNHIEEKIEINKELTELLNRLILAELDKPVP